MDAGGRHAVSLGEARRDVAQRIGAEAAQRGHPDHDGRHPVRVVVAPDGDPLARGDGGIDPRQGDVRIGHARQVVQGAGAGGEEALKALVVDEAATREERGDRTAEAGEGGRLRDGVREQPLEARSDHPAIVAAAGCRRLTVPLSA